MTTAIPWLADLVDRLNALAYQAAITCLGGNIIGIEITTHSGRHWVISADDMWFIGNDDEDRSDDEPAAYAEFGTRLDLLVDWADQIMGEDRPNGRTSA